MQPHNVPLPRTPRLEPLTFVTALPQLQKGPHRPYSSYVNFSGALDESSLHLALPATVPTLSKEKAVLPFDSIYHPLDWKLAHFSSISDESQKMVTSYPIDQLISNYEHIQLQIREMVMFSFSETKKLGKKVIADNVFCSITGSDGSEIANQSAFLYKLLEIMLTDLFICFTSPIKVQEHCKFLKKVIPELKKDLKTPTTRLLFSAFDFVLSKNSELLLQYLNPLLKYATDSTKSLFRAHGLYTPEVISILQVFLDWFLRLKSTFPNVGIYIPKLGVPVTDLFYLDGGSGTNVAFYTCLGLWDGTNGQLGYPARVWAI